jgi:hypothetical protein
MTKLGPTSPCKGEVDREAVGWGSSFLRSAPTRSLAAQATTLPLSGGGIGVPWR